MPITLSMMLCSFALCRTCPTISVFGMGYVGCVLTACLSDAGYHVTGVDINPQKVSTVEDGRSPVDEPGIEDSIASGVESGRVRATTDAGAAVAETDLSFLTVGTPPDETRRITTTNLYNVMDSVVPGLDEKNEHRFVVRSTVPPGTTRNLRSYLSEKLGDTDVDFLVNPEFLREGTALSDFHDPPYIIAV